MHIKYFLAAIAVCTLTASPAFAQISVEANGARAEGHWGGELGAGYSFGAGGFKLTPGAGLLFRSGDGGSDLYGRVEATYSIPMSATIGAGLRFGDNTRPYVTAALPLVPHLAVKANAGPHYYSLGLKLGL